MPEERLRIRSSQLRQALPVEPAIVGELIVLERGGRLNSAENLPAARDMGVGRRKSDEIAAV